MVPTALKFVSSHSSMALRMVLTSLSSALGVAGQIFARTRHSPWLMRKLFMSGAHDW